MPLVRFAVKNEYGLGVQELYKDGVQSEDPKAVLDGVAVAGLVGVLRQLGDLAQFAAEIFHGLQEQVASTSSRSRKLVNRVQRIEASLPSLEKAILSQTDHLRFAYTPGTEWHACVRDERNHFICDDLPYFIMDSYEECREPPRLQLLDRFDSGGPGSCLKRYSDPTFFRRASSCSEESNNEKFQQERKARKIKKRRSWQRSEQFPKSASILNGSGRMQFSSAGHGQSSLSHTGSTFDMTFKSDLGDQSESRGSKDGMDFIDCVSRPSISTHPDVNKNKGLSSSVMEAEVNMNGTIHLDVTAVASGDEPCSRAVEVSVPRSSSATWDEKLEIVQQTLDVNYEIEDIQQVTPTNSSLHEQKFMLVNEKGVNQAKDFSERESSPNSKVDELLQSTSRDGDMIVPTGLKCGIINEVQDSLKTKVDLRQRYSGPVHPKSSSQVVDLSEGGKAPSSLHEQEFEQEFKLVHEKGVNQANHLSERGSSSETQADEWFLSTSRERNIIAATGLNFGIIDEVRDSLKTKVDLRQQHLGLVHPKSSSQLVDLSEGGKLPELTTKGNFINKSVCRNLGAGEAQFLLKADYDFAENELETTDTEDVGAVDGFTEGADNVKAIEWKEKQSEIISADHDSQEEAKLIEWSQQDLETVNLDSLGDAFSEDRSNMKVIEWSHLELESINAEHVHHEDAIAEGGSSVKLIKLNQQILETQDAEDVSQVDMFVEDRNSVQVIEWNLLDDIDSGTENFVDALNTIESESESDFESEMKREVQAIVSKDEMGETAVNCQLRVTSNLEPMPQRSYTFNDCKERGVEDFGSSITSASSANMRFSEYTQISHEKSDLAEDQKYDVACCSVHEESMHTSQTPESSNIPKGLDFSANGPERGVQPEVCEIMSTVSASPANMGSIDHTQSSCDNDSESAVDQKPDVLTSLFDKQPVPTSTTETFSNLPQGIDFCVNGPAARVEPAVFENVKSGSEVPNDGRIIATPHVSQENLVGSSTRNPVAFWTNGTLLGLQPSKPTVFSMPNALDSAPTTKISEVGQSTLDTRQKPDDFAKTMASAISDSEHGKIIYNNDQDVFSSKHSSHQRLQKVLDESVDHDNTNFSHDPLCLDLGTNIPMPLENKVSVGTNVKNVCSDATGASEDRSSLLSLLSRGLLKNDLRRSGSLGYGESHQSNSPSETREFDSKCQDAVLHSVQKATLKGRLSSPVNSPPSSPPLAHMKISFQPVDGFDTSRLKLKYPEGVDHYENTLDAFPSFQLVPEPTTLQHDIGSDSDNDTFCRSHACMSDDSLSHVSDSDSEQWDSGDSTESNDHTLYNGLRRISSAESASISPQLEDAHHGNINFCSASVTNALPLADTSYGLRILDAKNPVSDLEMKLQLNSGVESSNPQESTHEPPPLPPIQWRVSRPLFDEVEVHQGQGQGSDNLSQHFVPKLSDPAIGHPAKIDSAKQTRTVQELAMVENPKKVEEQKCGQEQTYHAEKERRIDEGGDFLQQIRTKSFNLKRTEPRRSTYSPIPATSNKITAILQKASAIRQAVGSDDGEDDSWSDT